MKKTIRRRTEITIETREIRTIRGRVTVNLTPADAGGDEVAQADIPPPLGISRVHSGCESLEQARQTDTTKELKS